MAEYIDREAFLKDKRDWCCLLCERRMGMKRGKKVPVYEIGGAACKSCGINDILEEVEDYPAADVEPVVRGEWVDDEGNFVPFDEQNPDCPLGSCYCSVCGDWLTASDEYPCKGIYCPNCGAKMEETNDG